MLEFTKKPDVENGAQPQDGSAPQNSQAAAQGGDQDQNEHKRKKIQAGLKLVSEIKRLFTIMTIGNKKYAEPSRVLKSVVDDFGKDIQIGEEKDITEFKSTLVSQIAEAFKSLEQEQPENVAD
jgi:hypothetical protein